MWVTSLPRRTDSVKAPGLDEDNRARKEPSKPRSSSIFSASTPDTDGWNHLREVISFVQKKSGVHKSAVGFQPWLFSPAISSRLLQTRTSLLTARFTSHAPVHSQKFSHTLTLVPTSSSLLALACTSLNSHSMPIHIHSANTVVGHRRRWQPACSVTVQCTDL